MKPYPYRFRPIYKEKIWGGRNLERIFGRELPYGKEIGESWELADLPGSVNTLGNGSRAGMSLTEMTRGLNKALLGDAAPSANGRFPLLLKLLDANDVLSLQVHPDEEAARRIGQGAAHKTECWYVIESRGGYIYKGLKEGVTPDRFRQAIDQETVADLCCRYDVSAGDFHYLPAGTVHALGAGVVVAEIQTPSDTTYRVSDWGRGRDLQIDLSMQCIHFEPPGPEPQSGQGDGAILLQTPHFCVRLLEGACHEPLPLRENLCTALMFVEADGIVEVRHDEGGTRTLAAAGDTVLIGAATKAPTIISPFRFVCLEITLPHSLGPGGGQAM